MSNITVLFNEAYFSRLTFYSVTHTAACHRVLMKTHLCSFNHIFTSQVFFEFNKLVELNLCQRDIYFQLIKTTMRGFISESSSQ